MVFLSYWSTHKVTPSNDTFGTIMTILVVCSALFILAYAVHMRRKNK